MTGPILVYFVAASLLFASYYCGRAMAKRAGTAFYIGPTIPMLAVWAAPILGIALFIYGFWLVPWYSVLLTFLIASILGAMAGTMIGLSKRGPIFPVAAVFTAILFVVLLHGEV